ncbi:MAG: hypothetical protein JW874_03180, partial [Spirochaetales bacterium]|nr:hypothetical protein [Spirochaetales bacterium]
MTVKRKHKKANIVLSLIVFTNAYLIFDLGFSLSSGFYLSFPYLLRTSIPLLFLFFPLLYFYIQTVCSHEDTKTKIQLYHFIPFAIFTLVMLVFYLKSAEEKITMTSNWINKIEK